MQEFLHHLSQPYNLAISVFLGMILLYWIVSFFGVGLDALDVDIDMDADGGTNLASLGPLSGIIKFLNGGSVPLTGIATFLAICTWFFSITGNDLFNPEADNRTGWIILGISSLIAIPAAKLITWPLAPFFRKLRESEIVEPILGQTGVVISRKVDAAYGQAEVARKEGAPASINCICPEGEIPRGETIKVVSYDQQSGLYTVHPIQNPPN
ncbi:OB-fold-containig protein [Sulfuriroseicoccus oceanibius]|uniref:NfeD family protein n=1 Tax=Sulfuriroseicoccus oceanibius TaxID=2707525 RepID=A0A6B3L887_9BACT|nr:OB-fold-containig protein [Sulfuriroseicoccus oceanibius]QQL46054.1 NfeD family protein [Sulfuriroseicoccus oceanibius]